MRFPACTLIAMMISPSAHAAEAAAIADHHAVIGRVAALLAAHAQVTVHESGGRLVCAINARMGRVELANGMTADSGTRWENELLPTESGIVVGIYGPFDPDATQKAWQDQMLEASFERMIVLPDGTATGIIARFGAAADKELVDGIYAIGAARQEQ